MRHVLPNSFPPLLPILYTVPYGLFHLSELLYFILIVYIPSSYICILSCFTYTALTEVYYLTHIPICPLLTYPNNSYNVVLITLGMTMAKMLRCQFSVTIGAIEVTLHTASYKSISTTKHCQRRSLTISHKLLLILCRPCHIQLDLLAEPRSSLLSTLHHTG